MAIDTTVGGTSANSYVTIVEADSYLSIHASDPSSWKLLSDDEKEIRLKYASLIINTLPLRGMKASLTQRLAFPRWYYTDDAYIAFRQARQNDDSVIYLYKNYEDIATDGTYTPPTIPDEVKDAQVEIAYQVIHSYLLTLTPMQIPDREIKLFGLGGSLNIAFDNPNTLNRNPFFTRARLDAIAVVEILLGKWIRHVVGGNV